jgi:hypothetical protein
MRRDAIFSPCGQYRYVLRRSWARHLPTVLFIALNPSTADHRVDDPTIRRCIGFAKSWGFGRLAVGNLFAYRSTDPKRLRIADDPVGPMNDRWLTTLASRAELTVAAWGVHGSLHGRADAVVSRLTGLHHLGITRHGHPRHPLYLPSDVMPMRF